MDRITKLKEYLKTAQKDSFLQHALALEYMKVDRYKEARELFNEILRREPTYIGSYFHLGKLLEKTGELSKALQVYQKGMEIAMEVKDYHSYRELDAAYEDLKDIEPE